MNVQELQTRTSGANVIVLVPANNGYLSIRQTHENFFGSIVGATPESGVDLPTMPHWRPPGIPATRLSSHQDLPRLNERLARNGQRWCTRRRPGTELSRG